MAEHAQKDCMVERLRALKAADLASVAKALGVKPSNCNWQVVTKVGSGAVDRVASRRFLFCS